MTTARSDPIGLGSFSTSSPPTITTTANAPTGYRRRTATGADIATANSTPSTTPTSRRPAPTLTPSRISSSASMLSTTSG